MLFKHARPHRRKDQLPLRSLRDLRSARSLHLFGWEEVGRRNGIENQSKSSGRHTKFFEWDRNNSDRNFYNVVRNVHIPLVPLMQERSEAERRAIWPCLNVATWRRERSDRAIQQIR